MDHFVSYKRFRIGILVLVILMLLLNILMILPARAQGYQRDNARFYRSHYRKQNFQVTHACSLLEKKRYEKPRKPLLTASHKSKPKPMAEIDPAAVTANAVTKPAPKPVAIPAEKPLLVNPKVEDVSPERLEALHKKEDEVLAANDLPVPTSQKHELVRRRVSDKLASKTNVYPLNLDPLFFNFNEDEFSMVDMEPFLMAAEYAMQGRTVLIEGHTDNRGQDDYNVKLSIKRVQKIRQLMLDMGVPDERISIVGYGEEIRQHANNSHEDRQLNRRVDFTIF